MNVEQFVKMVSEGATEHDFSADDLEAIEQDSLSITADFVTRITDQLLDPPDALDHWQTAIDASGIGLSRSIWGCATKHMGTGAMLNKIGLDEDHAWDYAMLQFRFEMVSILKIVLQAAFIHGYNEGLKESRKGDR